LGYILGVFSKTHLVTLLCSVEAIQASMAAVVVLSLVVFYNPKFAWARCTFPESP
jgi:hypothetical protein